MRQPRCRPRGENHLAAATGLRLHPRHTFGNWHLFLSRIPAVAYEEGQAQQSLQVLGATSEYSSTGSKGPLLHPCAAGRRRNAY